jgi:lauroyl/myristoyl acyltransferase
MREPLHSRTERLFWLKDVAATAKLAAGGIVVWTVPQRFWLPMSRAVARWVRAAMPAHTERLAGRVKTVTGDRLALHPKEVVQERTALRYLSVLQRLRVRHYRGFHPRIHVTGLERIAAALERGHGVILWPGMFVFSALIEAMALHQSEIQLYRLSNWNHGLSDTPFAVRWLNPLLTAAEEQYLAERIVRTPGQLSPLVALRRRLAENRVVGIRASSGARQVLDMPFLDGRILLATGAVELAMISGAEILPMFAVCNDAGDYEVHIEAPISVRTGGDRKRTIVDAATEYVARLEPYVVSYPCQWGGWFRQVHAKDSEDGGAVVEVPGSEFTD